MQSKKKQDISDLNKAFGQFKESIATKDEQQLILLENAWGFLVDNAAELKSEIGDNIPYHALEVARIAKDEMGLGYHAINAALLHELVELDDIDLVTLKQYTSSQTYTILVGLRKIKAIRTEKTRNQSENFIKLLLTVAEDIRSTLVQLADRLHHLRHYKGLSPDQQLSLAQQGSFLYAPVAHRLGLYKLKTELEDLAMRILEPEAYQQVSQHISDSETKQKAYIRDFIDPLQKALLKAGFNCEFKWRTKSIPSIWGKMQNQGVSFDQVYDVFAVRIILDEIIENEKADCWKVYSLVTDIYPPNPERLRDWVSVPKTSGYESLHTTVLGHGKRWVEVQIRSRRMDDIAEKGHAAHWQYKDNKADSSSTKWLKHIRELLESPQPDAFSKAHTAKADLYSDKIFVFTPNGDLRKLNKGATVLDFAFDIHTRIGSECVGAKVNGKNVTIRHKLENGDQVEIQTSKNQSPKSDWLGFVSSSKAKTRIKRSLKEALHQDASVGKEILERKFRNWKIPFNDASIASLIRKYRFKDSVDLYAAIADERIDLKDVRAFLKAPAKSQANEKESKAGVGPEIPEIARPEKSIGGDILEVDKDLKNVNFTLASCCNPIFGDDIFGFVTVSKGITIHRISCPNAPDLTERYPYRIIRAKWKKNEQTSSYIASIRIQGSDKLGIVNSISEVISTDMKVNMRSISFDTSGGRFEGLITVNVFDTQHLEALLRKLQKIDGINKAVRSE